MLKSLTKFSFVLLTIASIFSCKKEDDKQIYSAEIANLTDNVIINTYADLKNSAILLYDAAVALQTDGASEAELTAAKEAWVATRTPWEASEGFLFGPVSDNEIDPNIDTWPLDSSGVDDILDGTDVISEAYIENLSATGLKGFHLIEYLLWGVNGNKTAADLTTRELEYLVAAAENLKNKTNELYTAWNVAGGNFGAQLKNLSSRYPTEKSVLVELAEGIRGIAGEVYSGKIQSTLDGLDAGGLDAGLREEESRFSGNTKVDFTANIQSIQNIYIGTYATLGNGKGLSDVVASKNPTLDATIKTQIIEAINAIVNIGGSATATYSSALADNRASIEAAQTKVQTLHDTLENQLIPLINSL